MAQIRRDLHEDVKGVVEGAEAATDWRRFIRNYPWASMGVAVAVGYLIVPRKHRPTTVQIAPAALAQAVPLDTAPPAETKKSKSLLGSAFGLIAPIAFRTAQGYAMQFAEQWLAQKVAEQMGQHPDLAAAFGAGAPQPGPTEPQGPRMSPPGAPRF
jgi:hypothetical protein